MTESKGIKVADALMRKLVQVPKAEVSSTRPEKPKKSNKKKKRRG